MTRTKIFFALLTISAACLIVGFSTGCISGPPIQKILDDVLPPTFTGPAHFSHTNQYFAVVIDAGGLRKVEGKWTWDWLDYERESHFPVFPGFTWASDGKVRFGLRAPAEERAAQEARAELLAAWAARRAADAKAQSVEANNMLNDLKRQPPPRADTRPDGTAAARPNP